MATTVPRAFDEFAAAIKPTTAQEAVIASRRAAVQNFMLARYGASSNMPLVETKVIGSARRATLIRPVEDIDIFCVFDDRHVWSQYRNNSQQLLYRVREALTGYTVQTVGSRGQAVRLFYTSGPNVDITPAFRFFNWQGGSSGYVIPRGDGGWQRTDPDVHESFMARRNQELAYHLKPLVRLLKRWNREHSTRLRSFHLELMVQATFGRLSGNMRTATQRFFEWAPQYLHVHDPAGHAGDLASGLPRQQEQNILQSFVTNADRARRAIAAEQDGRTGEAMRLWRVVFGDEFPTYTPPLGQLRLRPRAG